MSEQFIPATPREIRNRNWQYVDIVLVTGDAYIDHPSFGVALIARLLESRGYRVAVLAQPSHENCEAFRQFGRPRLFFGITAGNLDSIVANYSGNAKVRDEDAYSPGGNPYFGAARDKKSRRRPDRAATRYAGLARQAFADVPVILGGLEASLRRFVHFDYQQNKLRASVLTDAKADLLVYGMGERAILEIAGRLTHGKTLENIAGTCRRLTAKELETQKDLDAIFLPGWEEINNDTEKFLEAEKTLDSHARSLSVKPVLQKQQALWILQNRPAAPLSTPELDDLYELPFTRKPHPTAGDLPAFRMIEHSVTIVRGCYGNCSFCAITRHQGPVTTSRSHESILSELERISRKPDFKGVITDLGGPTANMFATRCTVKTCRKHDCLYPRLCKNLGIDEESFLNLLDRALAIKGIKHVHISSGLRLELLMQTERLLEKIMTRHMPGALKIAPEHTENQVLRFMHKQGAELLPAFLAVCRRLAKNAGLTPRFNPYLIASHPGCTEEDMKKMVRTLNKTGLPVYQFQDFTPTPGTLSTAMYVSGRDRDTGKKIYVARKAGERKRQREILERLRQGKK